MRGIAESDCEELDGGLLQQEGNAWSSLAYVGAAVVLVVGVAHGRYRRPVLVLAATLAAEGIGSVLYHGAPGAGTKWLHDAALVAVLGYLGGWHVARAVGRPDAADRAAVLVAAGGAVAGGALLALLPDASNVLTAVGLLVVVGAELATRWTHGDGVIGAPFAALAVVAGLVWWAGRTGGPLCEPSSPWQLHGAWHLLTAVAVLLWADRTCGTAPDGRARLFRDGMDRVLGLAALALVHGFHRSVDVVGRQRLPARGPVLLVANHGNGFVDPVVVAAALVRLPRFLAKAALWRVVVARPFLAVGGILPVHRSGDSDRPEDNVVTFAACHQELGRGGVIGIFPEGTTGDRARLDRVRSGAARIALGALAEAPDLVVVPVGLAFESRVETRSRTVVSFGEPIVIADGPWAGSAGAADDPVAVHALTGVIADALAAVSPQFASVEEREALRDAAGVVLRAEGPAGTVPRFGCIEELARRIAAAPAGARAAVVEALAAHALRLRLAGLDDDQLAAGGPRSAARPLVPVAVVLAVSGPLVLAAALVHLPLVLLVRFATAAVEATATKGTVRLLVGAAGAIVTWTVVGVLVADGWIVLLAMLATAALGGVALLTWSWFERGARRLLGWFRARDRRRLADAALASRTRLVAAVGDAVAATQPQG